jgi:hypothetical protein
MSATASAFASWSRWPSVVTPGSVLGGSVVRLPRVSWWICRRWHSDFAEQEALPILPGAGRISPVARLAQAGPHRRDRSQAVYRRHCLCGPGGGSGAVPVCLAGHGVLAGPEGGGESTAVPITARRVHPFPCQSTLTIMTRIEILPPAAADHHAQPLPGRAAQHVLHLTGPLAGDSGVGWPFARDLRPPP